MTVTHYTTQLYKTCQLAFGYSVLVANCYLNMKYTIKNKIASNVNSLCNFLQLCYVSSRHDIYAKQAPGGVK